MKRIKYDSEYALIESRNVLDNDGIIVYPTDTVYGFGCNARNDVAIKKLNSIKGRGGPMSILAPNIKTALGWMDICPQHKEMAQNIIANTNTVVVPAKKSLCSDLIKGNNNSIGIRIPNHLFCKNLATECSYPITTTSVNRTGEKPMTNPETIENEFCNELDLIVEDGLIEGNASKIYLFQDGDWRIIR